MFAAKEVRLMANYETALPTVTAVDKKAVRRQGEGFWPGVWKVIEGEAPALFFFVRDTEALLWGNTPEAILKEAKGFSA